MRLINCKVQLKLYLTKHCVLAAAGIENLGTNYNNFFIIFTIYTVFTKTQNYVFLSSLYQQKTIKNYQNFLAKNLKDQCIGVNIKTNSENKNTTNEYRYFLRSNFVKIIYHKMFVKL